MSQPARKFNNLPKHDIDRFTMPNGSDLAIKLPRDTGGQFAWWRKYTKRAEPGTPKNSLPLLGCWSSRTQQHLLVADFDVKDCPNWTTMEATRSIIEWSCLDALVCTSPSGGIKVFFTVEFKDLQADQDFVMNEATAQAFLKERLPTTHHWFDRRGLKVCYLSPSISKALSIWLPEAPVSSVQRVENEDIDSIVLNSSFIKYNKDIPEWALSFTKPHLKGHEARTEFIRILLSCWNLVDGWSMPTKALGASCGVPCGTVSRWLKELQEAGLLTLLDPSYIVGIKAKKYQAKGALTDFIKFHIASYRKPSTPRVIPTPKPGSYYPTLLFLSRAILTDNDYYRTIDSLPEMNRDRMRQARAIRNCDKRKAAKYA